MKPLDIDDVRTLQDRVTFCKDVTRNKVKDRMVQLTCKKLMRDHNMNFEKNEKIREMNIECDSSELQP